MNRLKIDEAVIVEGKYDKIRLEALLDALIIPTDGFGIFKDKEKQRLFRLLAKERGLVVVTDSDGAGLVIRNFLSGCVDPKRIKHVYIPQIAGKEKRKSAPSKEGTLGVEGMTTDILLRAFADAGIAVDSVGESRQNTITRERLYDDGYIGSENSAELRTMLLKALGLPTYISTSSLLRIINTVTDEDRYQAATTAIHDSMEAKAVDQTKDG